LDWFVEGVKMVSFMDLFTGRFGDEHRAKGGGLLVGRLVEQQSPIVHRLGRDWVGTVAFGRFLANRTVMPEEIFASTVSSATRPARPALHRWTGPRSSAWWW